MNTDTHTFNYFRQCDAKFRNGDSITDGELNFLIGRYKAAYEGLRYAWHESYKLVEIDLYSRLRQLEGFREARAEHKRMKARA